MNGWGDQIKTFTATSLQEIIRSTTDRERWRDTIHNTTCLFTHLSVFIGDAMKSRRFTMIHTIRKIAFLQYKNDKRRNPDNYDSNYVNKSLLIV